MTERDFYPVWKKYVESSRPSKSELYEVKLVNMIKTKSFSFRQVEEYQVEGLLGSLEGRFIRIMDQPFTEGGFQQKKLCDSLWIPSCNAYIVVIFWYPRKIKTAVMIPIWEFIKLRSTWKKKSIHLEELQFEKIEL